MWTKRILMCLDDPKVDRFPRKFPYYIATFNSGHSHKITCCFLDHICMDRKDVGTQFLVLISAGRGFSKSLWKKDQQYCSRERFSFVLWVIVTLSITPFTFLEFETCASSNFLIRQTWVKSQDSQPTRRPETLLLYVRDNRLLVAVIVLADCGFRATWQLRMIRDLPMPLARPTKLYCK